MSYENNSRFQSYKWATFCSLYVGYMLVTLTRKSFSFVLPAIMDTEGLEKDDLGLISSSFGVAYTVSKLFGGVVVDHTSPRLLFGAALFFSGILTTGFTLFSNCIIYAILWFLLGLAQGLSWPACAKIIRAWFGECIEGPWLSILSTATQVMHTIGPVVTIALLFSYEWFTCLRIYGTVTLAATGLCMLLLINSPADVGFSDVADEARKDDKGRGRSRGRGTWQDMLSSPFMWVLCFSYLVVNGVRTATVDWAQLYLIQELNHTHIIGSAFISSLEVGGIIGSVAAGFLADKLVALSQRDDTRGTPRMTVAILFVGLYTLGLHTMVFFMSHHSSQLWIIIIGFIIGFGLYGPIALYGVMAVEAAPTHLSGTSHAIVCLFANFGVIFAGLPFSYLAKNFEWRGAFFMCELLSGLLVLVGVTTKNLDYKMVPIKKKLQ